MNILLGTFPWTATIFFVLICLLTVLAKSFHAIRILTEYIIANSLKQISWLQNSSDPVEKTFILKWKWKIYVKRTACFMPSALTKNIMEESPQTIRLYHSF